MRPIRIHLPVLLSFTVACANDNPSADGFTVADSAGIRVIENHTPEWSADNAWQVSVDPILTIGGSDDAEQQLFDVDGAVRLNDGRIVVANAGSHQLKFFGADGAWLFNRGGEGSGPGEFRDVTGFTRYGRDSLIVFDRREMRRTVFSADGDLGSITPLGGGQLIFPGGVLADHTIIGHVAYSINPSVEDQPERDSFAVARIEAGGSTPDTILMLPGLEVYRHDNRPGVLPFARSTLTAIGGSTIYSADTEHYEIRRHDGFGTLEAVVRRTYEPRSVQPDEVQAYKQQRLADMPAAMREMMGPAIEAAPAPPAMPTLGDLAIDVNGNLWAEEYQAPLDEGPTSWSVFDQEGRWLGDVELPEDMTVYDIGDDFVLALERDEMDVEYVVLYELLKP